MLILFCYASTPSVPTARFLQVFPCSWLVLFRSLRLHLLRDCSSVFSSVFAFDPLYSPPSPLCQTPPPLPTDLRLRSPVCRSSSYYMNSSTTKTDCLDSTDRPNICRPLTCLTPKSLPPDPLSASLPSISQPNITAPPQRTDRLPLTSVPNRLDLYYDAAAAVDTTRRAKMLRGGVDPTTQ